MASGPGIDLVHVLGRCAIPETNPQMDVYRIGTVLEMVRELAYELAVDGVKVKVCVQQALGVGVFQVNILNTDPISIVCCNAGGQVLRSS